MPPRDRAAVITPTVLQIVYSSSSPTVAHDRVENFLRDELANIKHEAIADRSIDPDA
jgi:hypothetical protein